MKVLKVVLPVLIVLLLAGGWYSAVNDVVGTRLAAGRYLADAQQAQEDGLYQLAIQDYKKVLETSDSVETRRKICEAYAAYYAEEPTNTVYEAYIEDVLAAAREYPDNTEFWDTACTLYMDGEDYAKAYSLIEEANSKGTQSEVLQAASLTLSQLVTLDYTLYDEVRYALNGYIVLDDGTECSLVDDADESILTGYQIIGVANDEGECIGVNSIDARLVDGDGIVRARYDFSIVDAGCIDQDTRLVPVKLEESGLWSYLNVDTGELGSQEYAAAGSYGDGVAAVSDGETWCVIDAEGTKQSGDFEDVKLDLYGHCLHDGVALAKTDGAYRFYDASWNTINDFSCNDIDICVDGGAIAFANDQGLWGFVDLEGNQVIEPQYAQARSFANGRAAVKDPSSQLWGYVNEDGSVAVECDYLDALYFNDEGTSWVSGNEGAYQLLSFRFE